MLNRLVPHNPTMINNVYTPDGTTVTVRKGA